MATEINKKNVDILMKRVVRRWSRKGKGGFDAFDEAFTHEASKMGFAENVIKVVLLFNKVLGAEEEKEAQR